MCGLPDYSDFTMQHYRRALAAAKDRYEFRFFDQEQTAEPHVLWRHDLDASVARAASMAAAEREAGVRATYFLRLHSAFYNPLETGTHSLVRDIVRHGHQLALHFEAGFHRVASRRALEGALERDRRVIEDWFGVEVAAFSFHNPQGDGMLGFGSDRYGGMVNTYGGHLKGYKYVSDSNGYWRHDRLYDVLCGGPPRLHVLTHPEWWTDRPMTPRERIRGVIGSQADACMTEYTSLLRSAGRPDI